MAASSQLVPELLGFVPQFLLDDIVDTANDEVRRAVDAMEGFLRRWVASRAQKVGEWDHNQDIEQGLVAFQTLLYNHVDIAFDYFEVWSMRNIFAVRPGLPIVAPHQQGLNLDHTPDEEGALLAEIEELRRKINTQRKLNRLFSLAARASAAQRVHAESRLTRLSFLRSPHLQSLHTLLPDSFTNMYAAVASLPPHDHAPARSPADPGKRPWETSKSGYLSWARDQLVARTKGEENGDGDGDGRGQGSSAVGALVASADQVARVEDVKAILATGQQRQRQQQQDVQMDVR
ncbi:Mis12-domain-containing protein [Cristinia sonorae]|uniref:Mis12-domain-containing protein n=1 Tax=Cristinia sonorae TaxID=1940300 RepID=A0A8K0UHP3_9AGAR|nr:Mis12-domain-containing protein [Cristinia sonorae]